MPALLLDRGTGPSGIAPPAQVLPHAASRRLLNSIISQSDGSKSSGKAPSPPHHLHYTRAKHELRVLPAAFFRRHPGVHASRTRSVLTFHPKLDSEADKGSSGSKKKKASCICCRVGSASQNEAAAEAPEPPMYGGKSGAGLDSVKIGVITVSDRATAGVYTDRGGPAVLQCISTLLESPWEAEYRLVPDEKLLIESAICDLTDRIGCSLVITTGGTGPAPRDVTPEATLHVVSRELPGFGEQMRAISLHFVPTASLSRQTAGIRGTSLVLNLPGSPSSIDQILPEIIEAITNCVGLIGGGDMRASPPASKKKSVPPAPKDAVQIASRSFVSQRTLRRLP